MTLNEMLADLVTRIGSVPEVTNTNMTPWLNQGLLTFCNAYDFHWLKKIQYGSTVINQNKYAVPAKMKRMIEVKVDSNRYKYVPYEQRDMQPSDSKYYSILNNNIFINPTPASTGSSNIEMAYVSRPTKMTLGTDAPSDTAIAGLPEVYHEALVIYAFSVYNTYDEEHNEARALMGNPRNPIPGSFYFFVEQAKMEEQNRKRGLRRRVLSTKEYYGYTHPNEMARSTTVLGN